MKFCDYSTMATNKDPASSSSMMGASNTHSSDFNQWLHAMKMVARLPGGMPPEFRRKLWLALADQHLQTKEIDWEKEQTKCLCDKWRDDDEELGIQIVKDLHRTGSSLFSGPAGSLNQAKLKRVLIGYARWNPEVGYCQGFNMLAALILQVMDKNEIESLKVMLFLVEGILPPGYFSGSLGGLQVDMAVFRDLLGGRLPRLARHLQKLQGPLGEGSFEPPLTNVFTMQWFLTLFCTCLPINCVLRVWDLVLIEGSDILLRTALAIWGLLEERILATKTADDFYCKMGTLSGELLNGHLFDSNGLIQKVVDLGPIPELQKMRDKHLYNITPWRDKKGLRLFFSDDDADSDEDSKIAVTTAWGLRLGRRGSSGASNSRPSTTDNRERVALDISLLKKQYDKLRERQRQAHIILTTTARQTVNPSNSNTLPVNQYLIGRNAIVSSKGRRIGPPIGAIPPARKIPVTKLAKLSPKQVKRSTETLHWKDTETPVRRKNSLSWKECNSETKRNVDSLIRDDEEPALQRSPSATSSLSSISESSASKSRKKSESSSYSEDSDGNSSTSTSLCDDENVDFNASSIEASPLRKNDAATLIKTDKSSTHLEECIDTLNKLYTFNTNTDTFEEDTINSITISSKENLEDNNVDQYKTAIKSNSNSSLKRLFLVDDKLKSEDTINDGDDDDDDDDDFDDNDDDDDINLDLPITITNYFETDINKLLPSYETPIKNEPCSSKDIPIIPLEYSDTITSTSQLSPIADISKYLSTSSISPLRTPSSFMDFSDLISSGSSTFDVHSKSHFDFQVNDEGVTNQYFERVNVPERPSRLELKESIDDNQENRQDTNTSTSLFSPLIVGLSTTLSDLTNISPNKSPIIHSISTSFDKKIMQETSNDIELHQHFERPHFLKGKSYSLDETQNFVKPIFRPTSCPETGMNENYQKKNADRVSKIIEENSMILHRILKKNISIGDVEESFQKKLYDLDKSIGDVHKAFNKKCFNEDENTSDTLTDDDSILKIDNISCQNLTDNHFDLDKSVDNVQKTLNIDFFNENKNLSDALTDVDRILKSDDLACNKSMRVDRIELEKSKIDVQKTLNKDFCNENKNLNDADDVDCNLKADDLICDKIITVDHFELKRSIDDVQKLLNNDFFNKNKNNSDTLSNVDCQNMAVDHFELKKGIDDVQETFNTDFFNENKTMSSRLASVDARIFEISDLTCGKMTTVDHFDLEKSIGDMQNTFRKDFSVDDQNVSGIDKISEINDLSIEKSKDSIDLHDLKYSEVNKSMSDIKSSLINDSEQSFEFTLSIPPSKSFENLQKSIDIKTSDYHGEFSLDSNAMGYEIDDIKTSKEEEYEHKLLYKNSDIIDKTNESPSDISETISSIKNTIKSIDSLCQDDFVSKNFRKTNSSEYKHRSLGEPSNYSLYDFSKPPTENIDTPNNKSVVDDPNTANTNTTTPSLCVEQVPVVNISDLSPSKLINSSTDRNLLILNSHRLSRDHRRDASPRRRRDDEREEYESRTQRDRSPSLMTKIKDVLPENPANKDFTKIDSFLSNCTNNIVEEDITNSSSFDTTTTTTTITARDNYSTTKYLSLSDYVYKSNYDDKINSSNILAYKSHESNLNTVVNTDITVPVKPLFSDKFSIRHTTVTATLYDRYMLQKLERNSKLDKSPSSPIITKSYLDTLKPPPSPVVIDRNSKSAENSPSRAMFEINSKDSYIDDEKCMSLPAVTNYHIKSCDNIPAKVGDKISSYFALANKSKLPEFEADLDLYGSIPKISP